MCPHLRHPTLPIHLLSPIRLVGLGGTVRNGLASDSDIPTLPILLLSPIRLVGLGGTVRNGLASDSDSSIPPIQLLSPTPLDRPQTDYHPFLTNRLSNISLYQLARLNQTSI